MNIYPSYTILFRIVKIISYYKGYRGHRKVLLVKTFVYKHDEEKFI